MDHQGLINLIDRVVSNLHTDLSLIIHTTHDLQRNLGDKHLNWSLAHLQTSVVDLVRDLERHQQYLQKDNNAS